MVRTVATLEIRVVDEPVDMRRMAKDFTGGTADERHDPRSRKRHPNGAESGREEGIADGGGVNQQDGSKAVLSQTGAGRFPARR